MKNSLSIALFGGVVALASCASGPTPEEQAAAEQARLDSLKAVEQFRLDSMAQVAAEAEAAAYAAGQAAAEQTTTTTTTTSTTKPAESSNPITNKQNAANSNENPIDAKKQKAEEQKENPTNPILNKKSKASGN